MTFIFMSVIFSAPWQHQTHFRRCYKPKNNAVSNHAAHLNDNCIMSPTSVQCARQSAKLFWAIHLSLAGQRLLLERKSGRVDNGLQLRHRYRYQMLLPTKITESDHIPIVNARCNLLPCIIKKHLYFFYFLLFYRKISQFLPEKEATSRSW